MTVEADAVAGVDVVSVDGADAGFRELDADDFRSGKVLWNPRDVASCDGSR